MQASDSCSRGRGGGVCSAGGLCLGWWRPTRVREQFSRSHRNLLSTNPEEVAWGEEVVASWNSQHPDEKITAQQIPAGKTSEEVIYSSIVAGNAPWCQMNTAPSAVPQFEKAGGLVPVDTFPDGDSYIDERTGKQVADQYQSSYVRFYQIP